MKNQWHVLLEHAISHWTIAEHEIALFHQDLLFRMYSEMIFQNTRSRKLIKEQIYHIQDHLYFEEIILCKRVQVHIIGLENQFTTMCLVHVGLRARRSSCLNIQYMDYTLGYFDNNG